MRRAAAAAVFAVVVTGCAGPSEVTAAPYDGLWRVQEYEVDGTVTPVPPRGDQPAFGGQDALLFIDGERISLQAPCNQVGIESAAIEGDRLAVTGLGQTEMACSGAGVMELEEHLVAVIGAGPEITVDGDILTLTAADLGTLTLVRVEPDPVRPLVTSSAVEQPAEPTDPAVGSSTAPTPLPPAAGPELPTSDAAPDAFSAFPLDTFVPPVPNFMPEARAEGTLTVGADGCLRLDPSGPIVLWREGSSAVQNSDGSVTVSGGTTTGDRLVLTGGFEEPTPERCDRAVLAFSAYQVEVIRD